MLLLQFFLRFFVFRTSFFFTSDGLVCEQKVVVGACERAASLAAAQDRAFKARADVVSDLEGMFGEELADWKMTEIGDAFHALSCHNMTLPCSDKVKFCLKVPCCKCILATTCI